MNEISDSENGKEATDLKILQWSWHLPGYGERVKVSKLIENSKSENKYGTMI